MPEPKKRASGPMPSLWGADLAPNEEQTQCLDAMSTDSKMEIPLPMEMGEYTITRVLGRGGMGVVFEGEHRRMQRRVAIKVLSATQAEAADAQEQFLGEIRVVARLLHPRIVTAFDAGQFESIVYLVMEYIDGPSLFDVIESNGRQGVDYSLGVMRQTAEGLAHAHLNSVIHRDVKPGNIMVNQEGAVKILDLGLAALAQGLVGDEHSESQRAICGTPAFMAPEQFGFGDLTEAVDIYALGCTLFYLLAGRLPYRGKPADLMRAHCSSPIPRLEDYGVENRSGLQELVDGMMAKRISERFPSMEQVIKAIDQLDNSNASSSLVTHVDQSVEKPSIGPSSTTLGVDIGTRFLAAATGDRRRLPRRINVGTGDHLLSTAVASSRSKGAVFGAEALKQIRESGEGNENPVDHLKSGRRIRFGDSEYPASLTTSLLLQHLKSEVESQVGNEASVAVELAMTVPSAFGQVTRERLIHAAESCDFSVIRLVDRNLAAALSQFDFAQDAQRPTLKQPQGYWLVLSLSDLSLELSLLAVSARRVQMLSVAGDTDSGQPRWNRRLRRWLTRKLAKQDSSDESLDGFSSRTSELSECIDSAIEQLSSSEEALVEFRLGARRVKAKLTSKTIVTSCLDLVQQVGELLAIVLSESGVDGEDIASCLTIGPLARSQPIGNMLRNCGISQTPVEVTQPELAVAAANLSRIAQMPGRVHPRLIPCVAHDLGFRISDPESSTDVTVMIPRLTALPASVSRPLQFDSSQAHQITLVESQSTDETR